MKTSIVALIAASLFLVGTYLGVGSAPASPPRAPQLIAVGNKVSNTSVPIMGDLPLVVPGTPDAFPVTTSQILAVGRRVGQGSLSGSSSQSAASGPAEVAIGAPPTPAPDSGIQQFYVNKTISPLQSSPAAAPSPKGRVDNKPVPEPIPTRTPVLVVPSAVPPPQPTLSPLPATTPTPSPTPAPTPSVTTTVTPPPTSTATPSDSNISPSPKPRAPSLRVAQPVGRLPCASPNPWGAFLPGGPPVLCA